MVQHHLFNLCVCKPGESVATYIAELKRLSNHCDFAGTLEDLLCDRLMCGINDSRIQHCLLAEPNLTHKKANELALAIEAADKSAQDLQDKSSTVNQFLYRQIFKICSLPQVWRLLSAPSRKSSATSVGK